MPTPASGNESLPVAGSVGAAGAAPTVMPMVATSVPPQPTDTVLAPEAVFGMMALMLKAPAASDVEVPMTEFPMEAVRAVLAFAPVPLIVTVCPAVGVVVEMVATHPA